jgi:hypothetical protein
VTDRGGRCARHTFPWARRVSNLRPLACEAVRERLEEAKETAQLSQSQWSALYADTRGIAVDLAHYEVTMDQSRVAAVKAALGLTSERWISKNG